MALPGNDPSVPRSKIPRAAQLLCGMWYLPILKWLRHQGEKRIPVVPRQLCNMLIRIFKVRLCNSHFLDFSVQGEVENQTVTWIYNGRKGKHIFIVHIFIFTSVVPHYLESFSFFSFFFLIWSCLKIPLNSLGKKALKFRKIASGGCLASKPLLQSILMSHV